MLKIGIIGYGKMGKTVEQIAIDRGHSIVYKITSKDPDLSREEIQQADVVIEFTKPEAVLGNMQRCLESNVPIVTGTTGWNNKLKNITNAFISKNGALLHASNFSIGVNIFFEINKRLAELMNGKEYKVDMTEIHHTQKLDAPSGTAITLAEGIVDMNSDYHDWSLTSENKPKDGNVPITAKRIENVPGTHTINWKSEIDTISIQHEAHNRQGFALGAVIAAEWLYNKKGVFTMKDVLSLNN